MKKQDGPPGRLEFVESVYLLIGVPEERPTYFVL